MVTDARTEKVLYNRQLSPGGRHERSTVFAESTGLISNPTRAGMPIWKQEGIDHLYRSGLSISYCRQLMRTNILCDDMEKMIMEGKYPVSKFHIVCESSQEKERLKERIASIPGLYPISVVAQNIEVVYEKKSKRDGLAF